MQDRADAPDNVIWLHQRRGAQHRRRRPAGPAAPATVLHLARLRPVAAPAPAPLGPDRDGEAELHRLLTALRRLDGAVSQLNGAMALLEGRMNGLHDRLGSAVERLEAQKRQNARVLECLESGDIAAMEACRNRITAGRPF